MAAVVRILGPLELEVDGVVVPVRGAKRRGMLALLAARANTTTSLDAICDWIWPDQPLDAARRSVQTYVSQFRRTIAVVSHAGGYQLDVRTVGVDAHRFERLVAGAIHGSHGIDTLEAALGLWRGRALGEFADEEWARPPAAHWDELRRQVEDLWFAGQRAAGFGDDIIPRLEAACAAEPLRETRWEQLIVALAVSGRPAEALRAYGRIRAALRDEMGVNPSQALQDLELAILREDTLPGPAGIEPSRRAVPTSPPTNLRPPVGRLIGRDDDLQRLVEFVAGRPLVSVVGPGGGGKTRLAVELAWNQRANHPDGAWLVDLVTVQDDDAVCSALLSATGAVRFDAFAEHQMLIVLDNCEHVLDGAAQAVGGLLAVAPDSHVVVTSRRRLGVTGEVVFYLAPLPVPSKGQTLSDLERVASYELFEERARTTHPTLAVDERDIDNVVRTLIALEGVPLAIEIAASQLRSTSIARLAAAVEQDSTTLQLSQRDIAERHRSVAAAFRSSLETVAAVDRQVLEALSVCRGFDLDTARAVTLRDDAGDSLRRLLDASLVVRVDDERFRLLEPVRQLAEQQLLAHGDPEQIRHRLAAHMVVVTRRLSARAYFDVDARRALRHEHGNVEQALNHLIATGDDTEAVILYGSIGPSWFSEDGPTLERWTPQIRRLVDQQEPAVAAPARLVMGMAGEGTGERGALPNLRAALDGFLAAHRARGAASAAFWLARELALRGPDQESTVEAFDSARRLAIAAGEDVLQSWCGVWLGHLAAEDGDHVAAEEELRQVIRASLVSGHNHPIGEAVGVLADIAWQRGDLEECRRLLDRAVAACRDSDDYARLASQLRRRVRYNSRTRYRLEQAAADLAECGRIALLRGTQLVIIDTLLAATHYLDACDCPTLARSTRASIAAWSASHDAGAVVTAHGIPLLSHTIADALEQQRGALVDEYLADGLIPLSPEPQLRVLLQHLTQQALQPT